MTTPPTAQTAREAPTWFSKDFDASPTSSIVFVGGQSPIVLLKLRVAGNQYHPKIDATTLEQFVLADLSSLKERGRVKRGFTGLLSVFRAVAGMLDWPAGLVGRPGAVVCPVSR
jgi:hypothetical protein